MPKAKTTLCNTQTNTPVQKRIIFQEVLVSGQSITLEVLSFIEKDQNHQQRIVKALPSEHAMTFFVEFVSAKKASSNSPQRFSRIAARLLISFNCQVPTGK